ncbi:hypothetical protein BsWGS_13664 [Bradybaena similaris]
MTGGSDGDQRSGLENNARESAVRDFLLSAPRRRSASTLQLSMFGSEVTRSDEHIPLTSQHETAFVEFVTPRSCFLSNNMELSGRLRTSSLTMDVSTHKEIDSGNSSLIDSSSADSYQDFGSGCRSPTTSSSKSEQSLTSVNHNEFHIDSSRQRHSSVSDSIGGSSGKMSINTSDITESSEESLTLEKNKEDITHSLSFYAQEDAYSDSECQPFLFLPGNHSCQASSDDVTNGNSYHQGMCGLDHFEDENLNSSSGDIFNSTVININLSQISHDSLKKKENRRVKDKEISTYLKHIDSERKPLLSGRQCTPGGSTSATLSFNNRYKFTFKRSASLSNISEVLLDNMDTTLDPTVLLSPNPVVNSHTKAANQTVTNQPPHDCTSESQSFTSFNHHYEPYSPNRLDSPRVPGSPCTPILVNVSLARSPQQQPQLLQPGIHNHLCSNYDLPCMSHLMSISEYGNPRVSEITPKTSTTCISQPDPLSNMGSCFPDTSQAAIRSPIQNLESVLGYGTPASASVLKQGSKHFKTDNKKPLEVLVPKIKVPIPEVNQMDFTDNLTPDTVICQAKNNLNNAYLNPDKLPRTEPTRETMTAVSAARETMQPFTSNKDTSPCEHPLYTVSHFHNESHVCPPTGIHNLNQVSCERIPKEYFRCYFDKITPSICATSISGNQSEIRIEDNLRHSLPGHVYNSEFLPSNANQQKLPASNLYPSADSARLPTVLDAACLSEPMFSHSSHGVTGILQEISNKDTASRTNPLPTANSRFPSLENPNYQQQHVHPPTDCHIINKLSPAAKHTTDLKADFFGNGQNSHISHCTQLYQQYQGQPDKLHTTSVPIDESDLSQIQTDDNGYQAGMMLTVPKACFVPGFLEPREALDECRTNSNRNSVPSSIDSGHPDNRSTSLQCSSTSQLGLLKANLAAKRQYDYFIRELPDYKYLCFVATVLNPVLGLIALVCNYQAQKDLKQYKRQRANNFYFATIAFSTVAIFLTLIGGALVIAHSFILQGEKHEPLAPRVDDSCRDKLLGQDVSLQTFFGIDFDLYCEITNNEKIMHALKRYWLEDTQNRAIHKQNSESSMPARVDGGNATGAGNGEMQAEDLDVFGVAALNDTSRLQAAEEHLHSYGLKRADRSKLGKQLPLNATSNNSLTRSNENPMIPPGLQEEYERYRSGDTRSKINDDHSSALRDVLSSVDQSSSTHNDRESWTTTVSSVNGNPVNDTEEVVNEIVETGESYSTTIPSRAK